MNAGRAPSPARARVSWAFLAAALFIVGAWPPSDGKSLACTLVNWIADPAGVLPVLPDPLALGMGDDPAAVAAHDEQVQRYDEFYLRGPWMRRRLALKVARDPFDATTTRQVLAVAAVVTAFVIWRRGPRPGTAPADVTAPKSGPRP